MEKKSIDLDGKSVSYLVQQSKRARNLSMTIDSERGLVVSLPRFIGIGLVERFLRQKTRWILRHLHHIATIEKTTKLRADRKTFETNKKIALELFRSRVAFFNQFYKFSYIDICIRNQKTLWGSCSRRGKLQFNYKLTLVPMQLLDYVVVHELCHLQEHNHGKRFWELVAKMMPNHKAIRKKLRKYSIHTT